MQKIPDSVNLRSAYSDREMRLPKSFAQKFFIIFALILSIVVALALPLFAFRETFFPPVQASTSNHHPSIGVGRKLYPTPTATAIPTSVVGSTPQPIGTTILPTTGKIMTGVSTVNGFAAIDAFENEVNKNMSVLLFYQPWGDDAANFPVDWVNAVRARGSIPMVTWEPWATKSYPMSNTESAYALSNIIAGKFDTYITHWAIAAKAWKNPFFLRFAPEMNGNWIPWAEGLNGNVAGQYVLAWRHVHDIFTTVGATNVTWVWCPNIEFQGEPPFPLADYYPGDAYVDWTAMDGFNWGTVTKETAWATFAQVFNQTYNHILNLTTTKPMMIAEVGCVEQGGNKANWIIDAYSVELKNLPAIKAIIWFDQDTQENWRIESSKTAIQAFSQAIRSDTFATNIYASYTGG